MLKVVVFVESRMFALDIHLEHYLLQTRSCYCAKVTIHVRKSLMQMLMYTPLHLLHKHISGTAVDVS